MVAVQGSGAPLVESGLNRPFHLTPTEDTRPSVLLLSHAAAYAAWYEVRAACQGVDAVRVYAEA